MKKNVVFLYWALMVFSLLITVACQKNTGQIILINNSSEIIKLAHIEVCKQVIEIENIKPHEQAIDNFRVEGDSHYDITIKFASGKELKKQLGYVTHGFDFQHTLVITETDIYINNSQVK